MSKVDSEPVAKQKKGASPLSAAVPPSRFPEEPSIPLRTKHRKSFENPVSSSVCFLPFYARLDYFTEKKKQNLNRMRGAHSPSPSINSRSRKMVKGSFFERNSEFLERKKQHNELKQEKYCFQPAITLKGHLTPTRNCADRSYWDSVKRQMKNQELTVKLEEREKDECSPIVQRNRRYSEVPGKLQVLGDPAEYMRRLKEEGRNKQRLLQRLKNNQLERELKECTHSPKILESPLYIRTIARNRKVGQGN